MNVLIRCALAIALLLGACAESNPEKEALEKRSVKQDPNENSARGNIRIAVDESFAPIIEEAITTFTTTYPEAQIEAINLPAETAIQRMLSTDSIRLAVTTRELSSAEKKSLRDQRTSAKVSPIAIDAIAFILHPTNPDTTFTIEQVQGLLNGDISRWEQIAPNSDLGPVSVVFDNARSSTFRYLRENVLDGSRPTSPQLSQAGSNPAVITYVRENPNAIGIVGVSWISDNTSRKIPFDRSIRVAALESPQGCEGYEGEFFQPYQGLIKLGCYPFTRTVYVVSREMFYGLGSGFGNFLSARETGQRIILKAGLVPTNVVHRIVRFPERESADNPE